MLINDSIEYGHIRGELSGENRLMSDVSEFNGAGTVAYGTGHHMNRNFLFPCWKIATPGYFQYFVMNFSKENL